MDATWSCCHPRVTAGRDERLPSPLDSASVGFACPPYSVVGYGLAVAPAFRDLPFFGLVKGDA